MAENSGISWTHNTQNFWVGCDKVAPECAKCYISRILSKQGREPWGKVYRTGTWGDPWKWEREGILTGQAKRVFTCSLSDFFHVSADPWRTEAWAVTLIERERSHQPFISETHSFCAFLKASARVRPVNALTSPLNVLIRPQ